MIRKVTHSDLTTISRLHLSELPQTMNSKIGEWFINHLYSVVLSNNEISQVWILEENNSTIGMISTTTNKKLLMKRIFKGLKFSKWFRIIIFLLTNPLLAFKSIAFSLFANKDSPIEKIFILTIAVSKSHQRNQAESKLLSHIEKLAREDSKMFIQVDTEKNNFQANKFYKKHSYKELQTVLGNVVYRKLL